ncbi:hypothetical protein NO1_0588 [Candidatus Termititenax aidoneus]|uniref:Phage capsid protein n=1 Tax=Termititenax aidoneus TaxID=2218524 RepID=A0A388T965_TERA1|nr:hypothetical protein NO1_0588 [Candidatus Termititenax aidoneus]
MTTNEKVYKVFLRGMSELFSKPMLEPSRKVATRNLGVKWLGSEGREKLLKEMYFLHSKIKTQKLAATGYDAATLKQFFADLVLDVQARVDDLTDYSQQLMTVLSRPDATKEVKLRDILPYVGREGVNSGTNDAFPLLQHALGTLDEVIMEIRGFGDLYGLNEELFDQFFAIDRITEGASRVIADEANADFFTPVVSATYDAAHSVTFDTTGATNELKIYNTVNNAVDKVLNLYNPLAKKYNYELNPTIELLLNPRNKRHVVPIVTGELSKLNGINQLTGALVDNIINYSGGLNDGASYGEETLSYPGVAVDTAYVVAKTNAFGAYKINKVDTTLDIQEADILTSAKEKRRWYRCRGIYLNSTLPSTIDGKVSGTIVKLPLKA